jgi:Uma2 family endonuclease
MSTVRQPRRKVLPPLVAGERLDQPTFHERYEAMPPETQAELVGGVVCMPSPVRGDHGGTSRLAGGWLCYYQWKTPGVRGADNVTVKLDLHGEPQPDNILWIPAELGGRISVDSDGYLTGAPELVIEVARSSRRYDLTDKKADYERAGVLEYVVIELEPDRIHRFIRRGRRFVALRPGSDGIYRSKVFPGLWLDGDAFFAGDLDVLFQLLDKGIASPEHAAFVAKLANARERIKDAN